MRGHLFVTVVGTALALLVGMEAEAGPRRKKPQIKSATELTLTKTYPVADLVIPIAQYSIEGGSGDARAAQTTLHEPLMELICNTLAPNSWSAKGGAGKIEYHRLGLALVVTQTKENHEEIHELLSALRRLQDLQVSVEVRVLTLSEASFKKLGPLEWSKADAAGNKDTDVGRLAHLDDAQMKRLLESAQQDRGTRILQAPKITMFNGQRAVVQATDERFFLTGVKAQKDEATGAFTIEPKNERVELGYKFEACPVVAADHRSVLLDLRCRMAALASETIPLMPLEVPVPGAKKGQAQVLRFFLQQPEVIKQSIDQKFRIPDGRSVLIHAGRQLREVREETGPAVLSKIPCLSRCFRNVGYGRETEYTVIVVTSRIIVNSEEAAVFTSDSK